MTETIFALASGAGRGAVAILRLSGPAAGDILCALTKSTLPPARRAVLRRLLDPDTGELLDDALALWFPGPHSFTGEDVAELHLHGGRAVIAGVSECLAALGARPAEPGEFSRRAFHAGRLDLTQAEAIADLVAA
ncbi:MAG: tRNA uridine-5-carboxymethylaminomethyl(34) synthesis GTPase MnmE, partial [Alphaproteobacteria bacterium]